MTMSYPLPFPEILFIILAALFLYDEFYGLLVLFGGYILWDRNFAYTHVMVGSLPLYVSEFCLMVWAIKFIALRPRRLYEAWLDLPRDMRWGWVVFVIAGIFSLCHGLWNYPTMAVLRDSA